MEQEDFEAGVYEHSDAEDETPVEDTQSSKIRDLMDSAENKSTPVRMKALKSLIVELSHNALGDKLDDCHTTLLYICEKSIKKGKSDEISLGARLLQLVAAQSVEYAESVAQKQSAMLIGALINPRLTGLARSDCCRALAMVNFLGNEDFPELKELLTKLEEIFSASYYKKEKTAKAVSTDLAELHATAINGYSLLLSSFPANAVANFFIEDNIKPSMPDLVGLLQSPNLNVRLATGELIALIIEKGRYGNEEFLLDDITEVLSTLKEMAADSSKNKAKEDRKAQRASFREIISFIEDNEPLNENVKISTQTLEINTWVSHHQYNAMCELFGTGTTAQLQKNSLVRDVFELGSVELQSPYDIMVEKKRQKSMHSILDKARTVVRNKGRRDKEYGSKYNDDLS